MCEGALLTTLFPNLQSPPLFTFNKLCSWSLCLVLLLFIFNCRALAHSIHMYTYHVCHCSSFHNLLYVPGDCFVEIASAGFYFGCKVKHLPSCSVSTGNIQRVIIALVYSVNVCQMDTAAVAACAGKGPLQEKGKRKKEEALWFPSWVLLPLSTVVDKLLRERLAEMEPKGVIVL